MLSTPANIIDAIENPAFFGHAFKTPETWRNWESLWRVAYGLEMTQDDKALFTACTGRMKVLDLGYREIYVIAGRRSGKTRQGATLCAYEALWGHWADHLAAGERAYLFLFAVDRQQAGVAFNYVKGLIELFPDEIEKITSDEIFLRNRVTIMVKTSNYASSRGFACAGIFLDELAFYPTEQYASPAEELVTALLPSLIPGGFIFGASTPYGRAGYLWDIYESCYGQDEEDVLVWKAETRTLNPTFSESIFKRLFKRNKVHMTTELGAEFRSDIEAFLPDSIIKQMMTEQPSLPEDGQTYFAFLDPSGGRVDSFTMAIAHMDLEAGKVVMDRLEEFVPPFSPEAVAEFFSEILKSFGISRCFADRFGGELITELFRNRGILVEAAPLPASELYLEFLMMAQMNRVRLIDHEKLRLQLHGLERRTRSGGRDLVTHQDGAHDDLANCAAGVCVCSRRHYIRWTPKEQEARLPRRGAHQISARDFLTAKEAQEADLRADSTTIMDEFMGGANRRVRW